MVLQCQACNKVKKFGKWIEVPESLGEILNDIKVIKMLCPQCQGNVLYAPSLEEVVLREERTGAGMVNTVSLR